MGKILVADDEEMIRKCLRRTFERFGHDVVEAHDGAEGLSIALSQQVDVITTDLFMGGNDGVAFIRDLRDAGNDTPLYVISGSLESDLWAELVELVGEGSVEWLIPKPFPMKQLEMIAAKVAK